MSIRALLVEDHEITRLGMRTMLKQIAGLELVGEATSGITAISLAKELHPDLVLMDIGLPGLDGIEATKRIKELLQSKVILITSHDSDEDILAGLSAGAEAYCLKGINTTQLNCAIQAVMEGAVWLDPGISRQLVSIMSRSTSKSPRSARRENESRQDNPFNLSEREHEVLTLLVEGLSNREMAERMYLSAETIKTHMSKMMEKLRVSDRTQAAVKALKEGLVLDKRKPKVD